MGADGAVQYWDLPLPWPGDPSQVRHEVERLTGLELGEFVSPRPSDRGDSIVRALRIEPSRFELRLLNASADTRGDSRFQRPLP